MAITVTSDNFDEYFIEAMNTYGSAIENDTDVPVIDAANTAYKNISFEREAYANQNGLAYLDERKHFA